MKESIGTEGDIFPLHNLQPKAETQVDQFLAKFPEYDGRGVLMAILDTGMDPAAPGLQTTPHGSPKFVDCYDMSGAGDVITTTVRAPVRGQITGLTGRKLTIPESFVNPSRKYYLGAKPLYELYPKSVLDRMKKLRKERLWDPSQRLAVSDIHRRIEQHENEHGDKLDSLAVKWEREDLQAQMDLLKGYNKDYDDFGPTVDCVVWNDGNTWRACLDTSMRGELDKCTVLSTYRENREYARLSEEDMVYYSVNIQENGKLLEIVCSAGAHGTHVAGIAGAYFPDEPCKNGVAPGVQLVSMQISDSRLGTMESGTALIRALNKCVELGVDVVNFSFGEAADWANAGMFNRVLEWFVCKHDIVFVASSGNNGPALSTGGSPGVTDSNSLGVGAYVSPAMMKAMYSLREQMPTLLYPWSSRGPTSDGDIGVCVSAPGGAITCVPKWTLQGSQLMNGTSMSSPHVAGAVALLISSLKAQSLPFSPYSIQLALSNTAHKQPEHDVFSTGNGMLQVVAAHEFLVNNAPHVPKDLVKFIVTVDSRHRGIYIREEFQQLHYKDVTVAVEPKFKDENANENKCDFEMHCRLVCDADFIKYPKEFEMMNTTRHFNVSIDTSTLTKGHVFYHEIKAYDSKRPEFGVLWRVPITIVMPENVQDKVHHKVIKEGIVCKPGVYHRLFVTVPQRAEWAVLTMKSLHPELAGRFVLHAVQLVPQKSYNRHEYFKMVTVNANEETVQGFQVVGGRTLELCITKWWTSFAETTIDYTLHFRAIAPLLRKITMNASEYLKRVDVLSPLSYEELSPAISLKQHCVPLRPIESKLKPLGPRDLFEDGKQTYNLLLTYHMNVPKTTEVTCSIPGISDYLYESFIDCKLYMIFTHNKQYIASGETFPNRYTCKLEKGDYILKYQLRHEDESTLEGLKDAIALIQFKLATPVTLDIYPSHEAFFGGRKYQTSVLSPKSRTLFYVASPADEKLPKCAHPGSYLSGAMVLPKDEYGKKVNQWSFEFVLAEHPKKTNKGHNEKREPKKTKEQEYKDALRDFKLTWVPRLANENIANELEDELVTEYPDHLPVYLTKIKALVQKGASRNGIKIMELCDEIVSRIDENELLIFFGTKTTIDRDGLLHSHLKKSEMDRTRAHLLEALIEKGNCMVDIYLCNCDHAPDVFNTKDGFKLVSPTHSPTTHSLTDIKDEQSSNNEDSVKTDTPVDDLEEIPEVINDVIPLQDIMDIYSNILKFTEPHDHRVALLSVKVAVAHEMYGRALKLITKLTEDKATKDNDNIIIQLCKKLGWIHVSDHQNNTTLIRYPKAMRPF